MELFCSGGWIEFKEIVSKGDPKKTLTEWPSHKEPLYKLASI